MTQVNLLQAITDEGCQEYGFHWSGEAVQRRMGKNDSDKRVVNSLAQIAVMDDTDKFNQAFPGYILQMSNGTSLRVKCQDFGRDFDGKDIPANRKRVMEHLMGARVHRTSVVRRSLPNGQVYTGVNEVEFRQLYAAALVDQGIESSLAIQIARTIAW